MHYISLIVLEVPVLLHFARKRAERFDIYLHLQTYTQTQKRSCFEVLISDHKHKEHNVADPSGFILADMRENKS